VGFPDPLSGTLNRKTRHKHRIGDSQKNRPKRAKKVKRIKRAWHHSDYNGANTPIITRGPQFDRAVANADYDHPPWIDDPVGETGEYDQHLYDTFGLIVYD
jgi:hypothetical protein